MTLLHINQLRQARFDCTVPTARKRSRKRLASCFITRSCFDSGKLSLLASSAGCGCLRQSSQLDQADSQATHGAREQP